MTTIPLYRRFLPWTKEEAPDFELLERIGSSSGLLGWPELLEKRRVVLLAEAGSGKSTELAAQAPLLRGQKKLAFYTTVQSVSRNGLSGAIVPKDRPLLESWRSGNERAWFFIDSIDEAKGENIPLDQFLLKMAEGIHGAEGRAHIFLSGRYTDWEFTRDARCLSDYLPIPPAASGASPDSALLVSQTLRRERPKPKDEEQQLIVLMAPLGRTQVAQFAEGKAVNRVNDLLAEIDRASLWRFAKRPLDLEWMVEYWRANARLGSLQQMVAASISHRLDEKNPAHRRKASLSKALAVTGLERIGASMTLCRRRTLAIPDEPLALARDEPLELASILAEWSPEHIGQLLLRPVFDPATLGRARLHNDNEGVVRSYLTADWLLRLSRRNLSKRQLFDLLFAEQYGVAVVKPTMAETAAWLSLSHNDVAGEVARRMPEILLTKGDPASLPLAAREAALATLVTKIASGDESPSIDYEQLERFAKPDLARVIHQLWSEHGTVAEVQALLLRLIWQGRISTCADFACEAAFDTHGDRYLVVTAGRALAAIGSDEVKQRFADHVVDQASVLPGITVWEAVEELFPSYLTVAGLLTVLQARLSDKTDDAYHFERQTAAIVERIKTSQELVVLIDGLLPLIDQARLTSDEEDVSIDGHLSNAYMKLMAVAASQLLSMSPVTDSPLQAVDAILRIGERLEHRGRADIDLASAHAAMTLTPERKRVAFWHAVERWRNHDLLTGRGLLHLDVMHFFGWAPTLHLSDADWLLADIPTLSVESDQQLAVNALINIWLRVGKPDELLARMRRVTAGQAKLTEMIDEAVNPARPTAQDLEEQRRVRKLERHSQSKQVEMEKGWTDFINEMKANPAQLRQLRAPDSKGVDGRLYDLWRLLDLSSSGSRHAIESVEPVLPLVGKEVADALEDALIDYWRQWQPVVRSQRTEDARDTIRYVDCMGITGVTLEAARNPEWAAGLSQDEAKRATEFATLEMNGFPAWIDCLAAAHPGATREVLWREVLAELNGPVPPHRYQILSDIQQTGSKIASLLAADLWQLLSDRPGLDIKALEPVVDILLACTPSTRSLDFEQLAINRFEASSDPVIGAFHLAAAFTASPTQAMEALEAKLAALTQPQQTALMERVLPRLFGGRYTHAPRGGIAFTIPMLARLVRLAHRTVRVTDDRDRANGKAYSPDYRDDAESARHASFHRLVNTPGREAFDAILGMINDPDIPVPPSRLKELAMERAREDADGAPWQVADVLHFEQKFEKQPHTTTELRTAALGRIEAMQHDLVHGDYQQGNVLALLPDEAAVQNWLAHQLEQLHNEAYDTSREPHVADEKEPDIRLTARASGVRLPIEVKVAESWSLAELETALADQVCGRYLRDRDCREGLLLLVHQHPRALGWERLDGTFMSFQQLVEHLEALASDIRAREANGPQPYMATLDVSRLADTKTGMKRATKGSSAKQTS